MPCRFIRQDIKSEWFENTYKHLGLKNHSATLLDLPVNPWNTKESDMRKSPILDNKNYVSMKMVNGEYYSFKRPHWLPLKDALQLLNSSDATTLPQLALTFVWLTVKKTQNYNKSVTYVARQE